MLFQRETSILSASIKKSLLKKVFIQHKLLKPIVNVLPHHASMPVVNMTNDMSETCNIKEYLFIADCC